MASNSRSKRKYFRDECDRSKGNIDNALQHLLNVVLMFSEPVLQAIDSDDIPNSDYLEILEAANLAMETLQIVQSVIDGILENR